MAKCWTCGNDVEEPTYTCQACENSTLLDSLRQHASAASEPSETLALLEERAVEEVRRSTTSLSRMSSVMPEWRSVMTRMLETRGIVGLTTAVRWGFGELSWRAHQASDVLEGINGTLKTPSATQADEWRLMAEELRARGVLRESEEFYLKALEINRLDYRIYVGLAETYIRQCRFDQARAMLERSLPHAPVEDIDYRSHSYRMLGHISECEGDYATARRDLEKAVELSQAYVEARYDLAQYSAQSGEHEAALEQLAEVLRERPSYWYLANVEPNFDPVRVDVDDLLASLLAAARAAAVSAIEEAEAEIAAAAAVLPPVPAGEEPGEARDHYERAIQAVEQAREEAVSDDYLTLLEAGARAENAAGQARAAIAALSAPAAEERGDGGGPDASDGAGSGPDGGSPAAGGLGAGGEEASAAPQAKNAAAAGSAPAKPATRSAPAKPRGGHVGIATVTRNVWAEYRANPPSLLASSLAGGLRSSAVLTPIAAFAFGLAGFVHGSMVMDIDNLDAPFLYTWSYISRGTLIVLVLSFALGAFRARGRALDEENEVAAVEAAAKTA